MNLKIKFKIDLFNTNPIIYGIYKTYDDYCWEPLKVSTNYKELEEEVKYLNSLPIYFGEKETANENISTR